MPRNHKRSKAVADLRAAVEPVQLKHHDALKILAHPQMHLLIDAISRFAGVTTYATALHVVSTEPCYQVLCEDCGWTTSMTCPECPGCGCYDDVCTGYRHHEFGDSSSDDPHDDYESNYFDDDDYEFAPDADEDGDDDYEFAPYEEGAFEPEYEFAPAGEEPDEPDSVWGDGVELAPAVGGGYSDEPPF